MYRVGYRVPKAVLKYLLINFYFLLQTVSLDAPRFAELGTQVYRLIAVASLMLVSPSATASDPNITAQHKLTLKEKILIIIDNASNDK
jgi:hypothetical protein